MTQLTSTTSSTVAARSVPAAMWNGARARCPACGKGKLFRAFLKIADRCPNCREDLSHQRADDAPAYFTIFIVGHIVVGGILSMEKAFSPEPWVQMAIWVPLTLLLSLALLPRVKGILVGLQWGLRMHGFGGTPDEAEPDPAEAVKHRSAGGQV